MNFLQKLDLTLFSIYSFLNSCKKNKKQNKTKQKKNKKNKQTNESILRKTLKYWTNKLTQMKF